MRNAEQLNTLPVSLSAMWAKGRYNSTTDFIADVQGWGFTHIEPNSSIPSLTLDEIVNSSIPVSSLHSPCPHVITSSGIPAKELSLSSIHESERKEAVHYAKKTIECAHNIHAQAVVIHLGEIPLDISLQEKMYKICEEGNVSSVEYTRIRDNLITTRVSKAAKYINAAEQSLKEISEFAVRKKILVGIETRYHFNEIPDIDEMERFLYEAKDAPAGYWHDTGHAEIQQKLGLTSHKEWLIRFRERLIGIHIHDVIGITDHYCPGMGTIEWDMVARYLPQESIKVCEIGQWNERSHMAQIIPFLKQKGVLF